MKVTSTAPQSCGNKEQPELLTTSQAGQLLNRSRTWLFQQARKDNFPKPVRITEFSIAWRRSELLAWIDSLGRGMPQGIDSVTRRKLASQAAAEQGGGTHGS